MLIVEADANEIEPFCNRNESSIWLDQWNYKNVEIVYTGYYYPVDKTPDCRFARFATAQHSRTVSTDDSDEWMYKAIPFIYDRCNFIQRFVSPSSIVAVFGSFQFRLLGQDERVSKADVCSFLSPSRDCQLGLRLQSFENVLPMEQKQSDKNDNSKN